MSCIEETNMKKYTKQVFYCQQLSNTDCQEFVGRLQVLVTMVMDTIEIITLDLLHISEIFLQILIQNLGLPTFPMTLSDAMPINMRAAQATTETQYKIDPI